MPARPQRSASSTKSTGKSASQKRTTLKLEPSTANTKRINPLTAVRPLSSSIPIMDISFVNVSLSQGESSSTPSSSKKKGKEKESTLGLVLMNEADKSQLWVDMYEPQSEAELAVHVRKVENVRNWLRESLEGGKLRKYRRVLVLTGPAGTAKSSTIRVLSEELKFEILEWKSSAGDTFVNAPASSWVLDDTMFTKFRLFLERASKCQNVFKTSPTPLSPYSSSSSSLNPTQTHRIILLEDLPNILHASIRSQFQDVIRSLIENADPDPVPIIIIVSDSGMRGEAGDERLVNGAWGHDDEGAFDIRSLLPKDVLHGPYVEEIKFNPIAPTLLKKALQALLSRHFASQKSLITGQMLDTVVESANGDIRSAIMALQFACIRLSKKGKGANPQVLMESITRREQSLALFHLMGKVLYNKRKADPSAPSATAKDIKKDQELDRTLEDLPALPPFLSEHDRKTSRVDVNTLYADSPIDSSLFSLYIHQNYTQFCVDVDECDGVADWLSWADSSGGEAWYQVNPYRFHLLALGTLHSLPTPVPRLNQKVCKPEFFDNLNKEKEAWEGVRDVRSWIIDQVCELCFRPLACNLSFFQGSDNGWNISAWTPTAIATELGGVLRARDVTSSSMPSTTQKVPTGHRTFSRLRFAYPKSDRKSIGGQPLNEGDNGEPYSDGAIMMEEQQEIGMWQNREERERDRVVNVADTGGWLESDDINYF
ncbi:Rad17 cell cycle checkpoint protein-domain-containing protein [Lentinula detonsa]|uniref:Rad17 cell cycle checkpoint protein-domain-containing protein n=1 Tax=Lentinula detonsa TaxID=2804962 RepID=A0A9W8TU08_9AGAR|nr:Rad17 cell cycle checkpoint protein-domain-containing protein [Lentinula detonsa]